MRIDDVQPGEYAWAPNASTKRFPSATKVTVLGIVPNPKHYLTPARVASIRYEREEQLYETNPDGSPVRPEGRKYDRVFLRHPDGSVQTRVETIERTVPARELWGTWADYVTARDADAAERVARRDGYLKARAIAEAKAKGVNEKAAKLGLPNVVMVDHHNRVTALISPTDIERLLDLATPASREEVHPFWTS